MRPIPELLAPAGDWEALRAAVANGADAVYFGLQDFNARHRAANFSREELPRVVAFLHSAGVRGYVTFNTLIFSDELSQACELLAEISRSGVDAVIVQDLGLARLIRDLAPGLPVHGSTQMTLTEARAVEFVRALGVERVILARELSISEIATIRQGTALPVEVFVHGALCIAYSGQCLTSESFGGRSANRGQCAQACRQPYELFVDGEKRDLGEQAYLLSPQDLASHDLVSDLAEAGVVSLKIEGRLKSAHYVAATTQTYRAALDAAQQESEFSISRQQSLDLTQSFSRGFSPGFLSGINHQELVQGRFPKHRGVNLGTVTSVDATGVTIEVPALLRGGTLPVVAGDGIVFDQGHPEQDEQGGRVVASQWQALHAATPDSRVRIQLEEGAVNLRAIDVGSIVWKTDDPQVRRRLEQSWNREQIAQRIPLTLQVTAAIGAPLSIVAEAPDFGRVEVQSESPLAEARKHPLTPALLHEQLGRLGGTPFVLKELTLCGPDGPADQVAVMAPKSVLNQMRRSLVEQLLARPRETRVREIHSAALEHHQQQARLKLSAPDKPLGTPSGETSLWVLTRSVEQLDAVLAWEAPAGTSGLAGVMCEFEDVRGFRSAVAKCKTRGLPVALATPRIIKPGEEGLLAQIALCEPDAVLVRNLASLCWFKEQRPSLPLLGDYALNVANELTADLMIEQGLRRLTPSYDLNLQQLSQMLEKIDPGWFEVVLHQHMPMFHMEHCVFSHVLSNGKDCHDCGRPCDRHQVELRDHVGQAHPLSADVGCRNTVFNAQAQSAAPYLPQLRQWGVRCFRVELLRESASETAALLSTYAEVLAGRSSAPASQLRVLNQLGVTRGTLEFA